jgi:hypothetical protein
MSWPLWVVIGLVVISVIITVAYILWEEAVDGYKEFVMHQDVMLAARITCGDENSNGFLVLFHSPTPMTPDKLMTELQFRCHDMLESGYDLVEVPVAKEPGYNAFRTINKNKDWLSNEVRTCTNSWYQTLMVPINVLAHLTVLPIWTLLDFTSQEQKVAAVILTHSSAPRRVWEEALSSIHLIETYDSVYLRIDAAKSDVKMELIDYDTNSHT